MGAGLEAYRGVKQLWIEMISQPSDPFVFCRIRCSSSVTRVEQPKTYRRAASLWVGFPGATQTPENQLL